MSGTGTIEELAASSDLILVAVSDRAIEEVAAAIPETNAIIVHPSGALPALRGGFSLHPLKSLPPVGEPSDLEGTLLVFEGAHRDVAEQIASRSRRAFRGDLAGRKDALPRRRRLRIELRRRPARHRRGADRHR